MNRSNKTEARFTRADGSTERITLLSRLDTRQEVDYYLHGGTFEFVIRSRLAA